MTTSPGRPTHHAGRHRYTDRASRDGALSYETGYSECLGKSHPVRRQISGISSFMDFRDRKSPRNGHPVGRRRVASRYYRNPGADPGCVSRKAPGMNEGRISCMVRSYPDWWIQPAIRLPILPNPTKPIPIPFSMGLHPLATAPHPPSETPPAWRFQSLQNHLNIPAPHV